MFGHGSIVRIGVTGLVVTAGMALATACGSSSDSSTPEEAAAPPAAKVETPKTTTSATARPEDAEAQDFYNEQVKAGTVRLAAQVLGIPGGKLSVQPAGLVHVTDHYYKPGTVVTVKARDGDNAKFAAWAGACQGTDRTCKVTMDDKYRVLAGFIPKKEG